MEYIKVKVYYQKDNNGNKVYNVKDMVREFQTEIHKLDENVVIFYAPIVSKITKENK